MAAVLLIVSAEMLYRSRNVHIVKSAKLRTCDDAREVWVFGEIFKVSSVERIAVNVHSGTEQTFDLVVNEFH